MNQKITLKTKLMYASGEICGGGSYLIVSLLFLIYLTDVVKLSPYLAGTLVLVGKIWDAVVDPFIGYVSDRTMSRFGKRRVYFLAFIPLFFIYVLLWNKVDFSSQAALFLYYLLLYLLYNTTFSTIMIPYYAMNAEMTDDYNERTSLSGYRMVFSCVSSIFCGVLPTMLINNFPAAAQGYRVMAIIFSTIFSLIWLVVLKGTKAWKNDGPAPGSEKLNLFKSARTVFRNKSFRAQIGMFLCSMAAIDFLSTLFIYYLTYCLGRAGEYSAVMGVLLVARVLFLPVHMRISGKREKKTPFTIGMAVWGVAMVLAFLTTYIHASVLIYIVALLCGFGTAAAYLVSWSIIPELIDVDEMISTKKRHGTYYGMVEFLRQLAFAITVFIIGLILEWTGYIPGVEQNALTKDVISILFILAPIILIGFSIFFGARYKVTEKKYKVLTDEINRRKAGEPAESVSSEAKAVCEELSGLPYKSLWDNSL